MGLRAETRFLSLLTCAALISSTPLTTRAQQDDLWFLLENQPRSFLSVSGGGDVEGGSSFRVGTGLGLPHGLSADFDFGSTRINDDRLSYSTQTWNVAVGIDPLARFAGRLDYGEWGKRDAIETRDGRLILTLYTGNWNWQLGGQLGEVEIFLDPPPELADRVTHRSVTRRVGAEFGLGYAGERIFWWLRHSFLDYERDLSPLATNSLVDAVVRTEALDQASSLADQETTAGIDWQFGSWTLGSLLTRTVSTVDGSAALFYSPTLDKRFGNNFNIGARMDVPLDGDLVGGDITLSVFW